MVLELPRYENLLSQDEVFLEIVLSRLYFSRIKPQRTDLSAILGSEFPLTRVQSYSTQLKTDWRNGVPEIHTSSFHLIQVPQGSLNLQLTPTRLQAGRNTTGGTN